MTYEQVVNTIDNKRRFGKACGRDVTVENIEKVYKDLQELKGMENPYRFLDLKD